jgi:hypothetical protein
MLQTNDSRRDFLKKTAYVTPLILTMNVSLAEAGAGSGTPVDRVGDFSTPLDPPSGSYAYQGKSKGRSWNKGKNKKKSKRKNGDD